MTAPIDNPSLIRHADAALLAQAMADARARTLRLFAAMRAALGDKLELRYAEELNPPLWELGHVGWFEEFWIARNSERLRGTAARLEAPRAASLLPGADALYDSSHVAHAKRWHLDLPAAPRSLAYLARVRERTLNLLHTSAGDDDALYFFRLALMHEAMHHEAGTMIAQCLALDVGAALNASAPAASGTEGEMPVPASQLTLDQHEGGFAFDNELGAHAVELPAFTIDCAPVTWGAYLPFIEAGGYDDARAWTPAGWAWRQRELPSGLPRYLARAEDGTLQRARFGQWAALDGREPAVHLSQHEALAWCTWAGRRLPTEHEWRAAVEHGGADFAWGQVWDWTASPFAPWPGFTPHPYRDYSLPWFDGRPVLKGGSFATPARMKHPGFRNYFPAGRNDVFAGFRSCAV
jgi:gamma-glutamyl hercynylcysteine S-oxide synthase